MSEPTLRPDEAATSAAIRTDDDAHQDIPSVPRTASVLVELTFAVEADDLEWALNEAISRLHVDIVGSSQDFGRYAYRLIEKRQFRLDAVGWRAKGGDNTLLRGCPPLTAPPFDVLYVAETGDRY